MDSSRTRVITIALAAIAVAVAVLIGAGFLLLRAINPVADSWVCSQGEAPARNDAGTRACFPEGGELPAGMSWEPFGNRPMPENCRKSGWTPIVHTDGRRDCVREGTTLPSGWSAATR